MTDPIDQAQTAHAATTPEDGSSARERTGARSMVSMRFELRWQSAFACHCDCWVATKLDLWHDLFPPELEQAIMDKPAGHQALHRYAPGELIPGYDEAQLLSLRQAQFNRRFMRPGLVQPRVGRFFPKGILIGVPGVVGGDRTAFRVVSADDDRLRLDLNHPLSDKPLELSATIESIWTPDGQCGGRPKQVRDLVTADGPGMQARWRDQPSDFWSDLPFSRADPRPDDGFYAAPRLVDHIDRTAIGEMTALYGRLIGRRARILDLMSSWHSHLPEILEPAAVTGLGMNRAELDANAMLTERVVHDLNRNPRLPFDDAAFDAVICSLSVEYLISPFAVFRDLARVLRPGGLLIVSFSNRWFPPKSIQIWEGIHEFERLGLVLEYFLESRLFTGLNTWSLRGLPRPADDKYADRIMLSDPVYAAWGRKTATDNDHDDDTDHG
jgi:SAM-dependent methyltransferase